MKNAEGHSNTSIILLINSGSTGKTWRDCATALKFVLL